jgi:hypothetical protein
MGECEAMNYFFFFFFAEDHARPRTKAEANINSKTNIPVWMPPEMSLANSAGLGPTAR